MYEKIIFFIQNPSIIEFIGITGSVLLAICAFPEARFSLKNKYCRVPSMLLWIWLLGEIFTLSYVTLSGKGFILTFNYFSNIILLLPVVYYWIKERI